MCKTYEISAEAYKKLWSKLKACMRYTSPNIDSIMKNMTVTGVSGVGFEFDNEYDRLIHKHYNPDMPRVIFIHKSKGTYSYVPRRSK